MACAAASSANSGGTASILAKKAGKNGCTATVASLRHSRCVPAFRTSHSIAAMPICGVTIPRPSRFMRASSLAAIPPPLHGPHCTLLKSLPPWAMRAARKSSTLLAAQ